MSSGKSDFEEILQKCKTISFFSLNCFVLENIVIKIFMLVCNMFTILKEIMHIFKTSVLISNALKIFIDFACSSVRVNFLAFIHFFF